MLRGTVIRAYQHSTGTNRRYWYVVANYKLALGRTKEKELQMRNVTAEPPVITTETTQAPVAAQPPFSAVAATAAAAAASEAAMAHLQQQQMPLAPTNNVSGQVLAAAPTPPAPDDAPPAAPDVEQPIAEPHGLKWFKDNGRANYCINGQRAPREWCIKTVVGNALSPSRPEAAATISRLDMFMNMLGIECLDNIVRFTNIELNKKRKEDTTRQEMLKFFGVCILATRFEFGSRAELWSTHSRTKYRQA